MSDNNAETRAVIVLGMHRSGTSVLSRALITLGVDFGSSLMPGKQDNPKGYFEDQEVYSLNESFLKDLGCRWHSLLLPDDYPAELAQNYKERAAALLSQKFSKCSLWGLKEPRITRLLPLWEAVILDKGISCSYILSNRNPLSVVDSLAKRNEMPRAQALALWAIHQLDGLRAVIRNGGMVVDYDLMLTQTHAELQRLGRFLGGDLSDRESAISSFVDDFLEHGLRHSHYEDSVVAGSALENVCLSFHHNLLELAGSPGPLQAHELVRAKEIFHQGERDLAMFKDWFAAVDAMYLKIETQASGHVKELREKEAIIAKLRSELAWLESKGTFRLARKVKDILS